MKQSTIEAAKKYHDQLEIKSDLDNGFERVYLTSDEDGHKYVIPYELKDRFNELLNKMIGERYENMGTIDLFDVEFSEYLTGGGYNLVKLYRKVNG